MAINDFIYDRSTRFQKVEQISQSGWKSDLTWGELGIEPVSRITHERRSRDTTEYWTQPVRIAIEPRTSSTDRFTVFEVALYYAGPSNYPTTHPSPTPRHQDAVLHNNLPPLPPHSHRSPRQYASSRWSYRPFHLPAPSMCLQLRTPLRRSGQMLTTQHRSRRCELFLYRHAAHAV